MQLFCKPGIIHHRHYPHVSAVVFSLLAFTVLGVGFPMLLLAQSIQGSAPSPVGGSPAPMNAPMSPPPGGQPGMQPGSGGPNQQGFGGDQGQGMGNQQGTNQMQNSRGFGGPNQQMDTNQRQGFSGPNQQGFGGDQGQGMGNDQENGDNGMSEKQQQQQEARQKQMEKQQLAQMKKGMKGMEQGINMFDKQITKLTKQGIVVPTECSDNLTKVKTVIAAVKTAETFEAVQEAGIEDLQEAMQSLDGCRQQLEMLARWPQTIKQLNSEIKRLESALKRDKSIVAKLSKQGIDLSDEYNAFETAISGLKAVRDEADSKIKSGDSEGAFSALEDRFFGAMQDVWQNDRIIQTMSNLGRFTSDFKRGIADAQRTIKSLKRSKVDTSALEDVLAQSQAKGQEIFALLKTKPLDEEAVMSALQELEDLRQQFDAARQELSGAQESRPWEQGPQQFKQINSVDFSQFGIGGGQQNIAP
ncbi:MAG: hypothetical protein HY981_04455 [Candidatus Magasanikbacteria bacterium]|nr:hypothetical protein [Candidatus Magasanikbacteria bacterium]